MLLSYFSNFCSVHPLPISLDALVQVIRSDRRLAELTDKYRATGYKSVKMDCPLFGVAALFKDGKSDADITGVTGLSMVDIDHVEPELLPDLRRRAESDPHTVLSYLTVSGEGLRIIFAYMIDPALTLDGHREFYPKVFASGNAYYAALLGSATDGKCKNISRLSALAHDADAYFNPDAEHRPHIASFCGTGNNAQFLSDPTGNRRWLPFEVERIRSPRDHPLDYDAIYAEAYDLYRTGFRYWFDKAEIQQLAEHNRQFETPRLEAELVQAYFRHPSPTESGEFMSVARAMQIVGAGMTQKLSAVNLGRAFLEQGFAPKRFNKIRGYVVVCRTGDEIKGFLKSMAIQAEPDEGDG